MDHHRPLGRLPLRVGRAATLAALATVLLAGCGDDSSVLDATTTSAVTTTSATATTAAATTTTSTTTTIPLTGMPLPPEGTIYHGVYPGGTTGEESDLTLADLESYQLAAGKTASWVFFSHNWYEGRDFPAATATWIRDAGSVPYIRLMLRSQPDQGVEEPLFGLQAIVDGTFDDDIALWCDSARGFGTPLLAEYGTEVNGEWFPWNGVWNGADTTDGYGDPAEADGPERFRDVYRHIIDICRDAGASNLTWVFHVNGEDYPGGDWNAFEQYYPGDEWIDWIGISSYGGLTPLDDWWPSFREGMDAAYPRATAMAPDKPVIVAEFGATANHPSGDQVAWATEALADITGMRWPAVIGFSWWNERWENDDDPAHDTTMRLQDTPELASVFRGPGGSQRGRVRGGTHRPPGGVATRWAQPLLPGPTAGDRLLQPVPPRLPGHRHLRPHRFDLRGGHGRRDRRVAARRPVGSRHRRRWSAWRALRQPDR